MVCDGVEGPAHEKAWHPDNLTPHNWTDEHFRCFVVVDGRESLVEVDWPEDLDWTNGLEPSEHADKE